MASFTEIIPQFNPYIQQLPVEAMVQVGMEKQRRYDEGIQRIQSQIEQVAGLSLIKPIHKEYLQSKLNELGSNLKTVAAGDFSNFQLVNSVGGMVNQVGRDPIIQNAVFSTKKYMKEKENMDALIKDGKGSTSRTWEFTQKANEWFNNTDLNAKFDATYKPASNWRKSATEVVKALTGDSSIKDDAFDVDSNGNIVLKDAMTRTKIAGISPEKIQQALLAGLSQDDWDQISVDGRYAYSNMSPEEFSQSVTNSYRNKIEAFNSKKTLLENAKSSTSSAPEKEMIDMKVEEINKVLARMKEEYDGIIGTAKEGNVEAAKARLYTNNIINDFAKAFSYAETSQTYEPNPFLQPAQWRENKAQEWKKFIMEFNQKETHHRDNLSRKDEENRIKRLGLEGYGGLPAPVSPDDVPEIAIGKVINQTQQLKDEADKKDSDFIKFQGKDVAWLEQQRVAWKKSPNGVSPLIAQHFNETEGNRRLAEQNEVMVADINQEATRRYGDVYSGIPKDAKDIVYTDPSGQTYRFTPKDFVDFNTKLSKYIITTTTPGSPTTMTGGKTTVTYNDEKAKSELSPKEYKLYKLHKDRDYAGEAGLNRADQVLSQNLENYRRNVYLPYKEILKEKDKFISDEIKRRVVGFQGVGYSIPTETAAQKESLASVFSSVVKLAESQKGGIANSPNLDLATLKQIAESGKAEGTIRVVEGTEFSPAMYEVTARGPKGTTSFRITPEQKVAVFGDRFEASPAVRAFRPYQSMMKKFSKLDPETNTTSPYMSTSVDGKPTNPGNSALSPIDFINVKSFGLSGNIVTADGGKTYSLEMNIFDPIKKKLHENIPYPRLLSEEEVVKVMVGLTDASVYQILNKKSPTNSELQNLQEASQKPF